MKVLVTGGTGFTGSHLVRRLLSRGHEVLVVDNQPGIMLEALQHEGAQVHLGGMTDTALLRQVIPGCEVVFHLAAAFRKINLPKRVYWDTNVTAMRTLLDIARENDVRKVVYCSTQGVHGNIADPPADENAPIAPEDYYQFTKFEGEKVARAFIAQGMDITILRPTAIYGPGDPGRFLMLFRQVKKGIFPFFGKGLALYHPLYIDNFMDAFELASERPQAKGQTYLIADEKYFTIREIVERIGEIMNPDLRIITLPFWPFYAVSAMVEMLYKPLPWEPPLFRRRADWFRQNRAFRIEKARGELGYEPKVDLTEGLRRTYEWYSQNEYL